MKNADEESEGRAGGTTIHRTLRLVDVAVIGGLFVLGLFMVGLGCWAIYAAAAGKERTPTRGLLLAAVAVASLVAGTACVVFVGRAIWHHCSLMWKRERFIVGKRKLQLVIEEDVVTAQLPYDNLEAVRLKTLKSPNGSTYHVIGITFIDPRRKDTFVTDDWKRSEWEELGFDYAIWDLYDVPLKRFYKKLKKAWEEARPAQ